MCKPTYINIMATNTLNISKGAMLTLTFMRSICIMEGKKDYTQALSQKNIEELIGLPENERESKIKNLLDNAEQESQQDASVRTQKAQELDTMLKSAISMQADILEKSPQIEFSEKEDPSKASFRIVSIHTLNDMVGISNAANVMLNNYIAQGRIGENNNLSAEISLSPPHNYKDTAVAMTFQKRWTQECAMREIDSSVTLSCGGLNIKPDEVTLSLYYNPEPAYETIIYNRLASRENREKLSRGDLQVDDLNINNDKITNDGKFKFQLARLNTQAKKYNDEVTAAKEKNPDARIYMFADPKDRAEVLKATHNNKDFEKVLSQTVFTPDPLNSQHQSEIDIINNIAHKKGAVTRQSTWQEVENEADASIKNVENINRTCISKILDNYSVDSGKKEEIIAKGEPAHRVKEVRDTSLNNTVRENIKAAQQKTNEPTPDPSQTNENTGEPKPKPPAAGGGADK